MSSLIISIYFKPKHVILLVCTLIILRAESKRSFPVALPGSLCGNAAKEIDGALLVSSHDRLYANTGCTMRFMSDDDFLTSKRLMLRFNRYNVSDCSVSLKIFYKSDAFGTPNLQLSCHDTKPPPLYLEGKYLTVRLDKRTVTGYDFEIVVTTFKSVSYCSEFMCQNHKCIDKDLLCDGIDHCFDNSDERSCYHNTNNMVHVNRGGGWISIPVLIFLALIIIIAMIVYRRRRNLGVTQGQIIALQQPLYTDQPAAVIVANYPTNDPMQQAPPYYNAPAPQGYPGIQQPTAPYYQSPPQGYPGAPQPAPPYYQPMQPPPQGYPVQPPYPQQQAPAYQPPYSG